MGHSQRSFTRGTMWNLWHSIGGEKKEFPNDNVKENLNSLEVRCPEKHLMN